MGARWIEIMGRLSPGMTGEQAETALRPEFQRLVRESQPGSVPDTDLPVLTVMAAVTDLKVSDASIPGPSTS